MLRFLAILVFLLVLIGLFFHLRKGRDGPGQPSEAVADSHLFGGLFANAVSARGWRKTVIRLTQAAFALMVLSGFGPLLFMGGHLSGYPLVLHLKIALLFVILLAIVALGSAHDNHIKTGDWAGLRRLMASGRIPGPERQGARKWLFWLILLTAIVVILSIALSMFPLFSSSDLAVLLKIHGFSSLFLIILVSLYFVVRN